MKKQIILSFVLALLGIASLAQERPGWVSKKPKPSNDTYLYVVESASGSTEIEARNQTFARVLQSTAMRIGQPINSDEINRAVQSGKSFEVISSQYNIPINKVCEYTEKNAGGYRVYVLCQVAKTGNTYADFDYGFNGCYDINGYNDGTALLMSAILPGSGQMYKRHYVEGVFTFLGSAGPLALGFLGLDGLIGIPKSINYLFIGVGASVYVINLIRAYTMKPKYRNSFAFAPTAIPVGSDMAYGVSFSYSF